jgi:FKBP-type peptidyl-prolyl cis-trans isomerase 2
MYLRLTLLLGTIGAVLLLAQGFAMHAAESTRISAESDRTGNGRVRDGSKVTVRYSITLRDNPSTTYADTEQFVQGQHVILPALEQRMAGMHAGEAKTFNLSVEEGFGPYDEKKTQTVSTSDLPLDAQEGDIVDDGEGHTAMILRIFPETAVLDFNHPLAGKPLIVTLQIVQIDNPDGQDAADKDNSDVVIVHPESRTDSTMATQPGPGPYLYSL